jgi:hypothetical protein
MDFQYGHLRTVRETIFNYELLSTFWGGFFMFSWAFKTNKHCCICTKKKDNIYILQIFFLKANHQVLEFNQTADETLEDPYDSIWLQLIAVFVYLLIVLSSCLMMAFTYYEQLYHGHYRTVINQLITNLYNVVCIVFFKK